MPPRSSNTEETTLFHYKDLKAAIKFLNLFRSLASKDHPVDVPLNITTRMYVTLSFSLIDCQNSTCTTLGGGELLATSANNISWTNPVPTDILLAYYRLFPPLFPSFILFLIYIVLFFVKNEVSSFNAFTFVPLRL